MCINALDTTILDEIIVGRVDPHIYAFTTETIPNYLKVGDTYRPVETRLKEWRRYYENLVPCFQHVAKVADGRIFRDYSVHHYLEHDLGKQRLPNGLYPFHYSKEFFFDTSNEDVEEAIEDIEINAEANTAKYQLYSTERLPEEHHYNHTQTFDLRPIQADTVQNFKTAVANGRTNLLMYAVMRFGKSFTAMCCSQALENCKITLIVSAKADVRLEWKETVEGHIRFVNYVYLDKDSLSRDNNIITDTLAQGKRVAVFLTLQDLQGDEIKPRHKEILSSQIDLLIVDETHFGARASQLGKILQVVGITKAAERKAEIEGCDSEEVSDQNDDVVKNINARIRLHLSGTPYRILMSSEFEKEDIVAFCQFTDIVELQQQWEEVRLSLDEELEEGQEQHEWDNPYYGFPQMIRFAFKPSANAIRKMEQLKAQGHTYAFSALFRPKSITKQTDNSHKQFIHEDEILELLSVIDGSKQDENILGFLNYDKIKNNNMCRHIVFVLPFRASCDAMEELLVTHASDFMNLSDYKIVNISGVDNIVNSESNEEIKTRIKNYERDKYKTITLTVNRMLTGSTVKQWDTMLYFKDTASPQEYDQAIFRLQNQYIETYTDEDGMTVKYNMKPQTLLVDFDPNRMFRMQELKSQYYNINTEERGNAQLEQRIAKELEISPIITLNHNRLSQVTPANVMDAVRRYEETKSIADESQAIPFDMGLISIEVFKREIESLNAIDNNKGIEIRPITDEDVDDLDIPDSSSSQNNDNTHNQNSQNTDSSADEAELLRKKFATYCAKILFFSFLTDNRVNTLEDIICQIQNNADDHRIAKNIGLKLSILSLIQTKGNPFILSKLDYKIQSINDLMCDEQRPPLERAELAMTKFARLSNSEVVTPSLLADELVNLIPEDAVTSETKFLDIAAVQGEMVCAIYKRFGAMVRNNIYSVPTSELTYELTRKVYRLLDLPEENIYTFYSPNLIKDGAESKIEQLQSLNPSIVCGVPPFSEKQGGGRGDGYTAIYQKFFTFVKDKLQPTYISMMMQSSWYTGGRGEGLDEFRDYMLSIGTEERHIREMHDYPNVESYIKGVTTLRGGICLFLWDNNYSGDCYFVNKINHHDYGMLRPLRIEIGDYQADFLIRWNRGLNILKKVLDVETSFLPDNDLMYRRDPFGIVNHSSDNWIIGRRKSVLRKTKVYLAKGKFGYIKDDEFTKEKDGLAQRWKVLIAKSSTGGDDLPHLVISDPIVSEPGTITAHTHYVIDGVNSKQEATNLASYMKTKFFRFMVNLLRSNQNMRVDMYRFAPRLDFTRTWTDEQLYDRYHLDSDDIEFINMIIRER